MKKEEIDYDALLTDIKNNASAEFSELLRELGSITEDDGYDFFTFHSVSEQHITDIDRDGCIADGYQKGVKLEALVDSDTISINDFTALIEEMRMRVELDATTTIKVVDFPTEVINFITALAPKNYLEHDTDALTRLKELITTDGSRLCKMAYIARENKE